MESSLLSLFFGNEANKNFKHEDLYIAHDLFSSWDIPSAMPEASTLLSLIDFWPESIDVHYPDIADESHSLTTSPEQALSMYGQGMGLLFNDSHRFLPLLASCADQLRQELSLPAVTYGRTLFYATPKGGGTAPHFDQNMNFVIQLTGEKTWWLDKNGSVERPLTRHVMGQEMDPELASYCHQEVPQKFSFDTAKEVVLKPGSVLYVPPGAWHTTNAHSDALSLNFTYSAPAYLDLILTALRSKLVMEDKWREHVLFTSKRDVMTEECFSSLLQEAGNELKSWDPSFVLNLFRD